MEKLTQTMELNKELKADIKTWNLDHDTSKRIVIRLKIITDELNEVNGSKSKKQTLFI